MSEFVLDRICDPAKVTSFCRCWRRVSGRRSMTTPRVLGVLGHRWRGIFILAAGKAVFITKELSRIGWSIRRVTAGSTVRGEGR
jgi:hypothetical protein